MNPNRYFLLSTVTGDESLDSVENYGIRIPEMDDSLTLVDIQGATIAAGSIVTDKCLSRILVAATLLKGSAKRPKLDVHANRNARLSWKAIAADILRESPASREEEDEAEAMLPIELLRVLRLSPLLRQCFVLRILMAMPRQYCAGLLRIDAEEVDANSCLAARNLAAMAGGKREFKQA